MPPPAPVLPLKSSRSASSIDRLPVSTAFPAPRKVAPRMPPDRPLHTLQVVWITPLAGLSDTHVLTHVSHRQKRNSTERLEAPETVNPNIGSGFNDKVRGISCTNKGRESR
ncbi:hypothetical protein BCR34DRAFT_586145 [Clohesyomyces aquaticus]|uniref:Uncharacterized protein n=1 Tax=Clohesyomyces aquaticus TaxID=1231657 RepID=A0A1Y1ZVX9_9PLEO|nr:hypothetical protein BCR34DRAFT_586145 [Clohesyomyces aquaticus]